jgi:hypothetical protein
VRRAGGGGTLRLVSTHLFDRLKSGDALFSVAGRFSGPARLTDAQERGVLAENARQLSRLR